MVKRVLMIGMFPPPYSSGETIVNLTVKQILSEKYQTEIINVSTGKFNSDRHRSKKIANQLKSLFLYFKAIWIINKKINRNDYHAFYFVTPSSSFGHIRDWIMIMSLRHKIKKVYAFIHNGDFEKIFKEAWHKKITHSFISRVNKFIFLSDGLARQVEEYVSKDKCEVIRNSIDASVTFSSEEISRKINSKDPRITNVVYISNMTPSKGYMDLAYAIKFLNEVKRNSNLKVHFIGEWLSTEQEEAFISFVKENSLENIIKILGKINDRQKLKKLMYEGHIFILPTYFPKEAQPLSIIEALNAGMPVITTRHASIPEYIQDGYNGLFVEAKAPEQIAEAIQKLNNDVLLKRMSLFARNSFVEMFGIERYKTDLFRLFDNK
jgi:glycosyltransferase involved in cell wall biosynthesis